jgi:hypothetical protein
MPVRGDGPIQGFNWPWGKKKQTAADGPTDLTQNLNGDKWAYRNDAEYQAFCKAVKDHQSGEGGTTEEDIGLLASSYMTKRAAETPAGGKPKHQGRMANMQAVMTKIAAATYEKFQAAVEKQGMDPSPENENTALKLASDYMLRSTDTFAAGGEVPDEVRKKTKAAETYILACTMAKDGGAAENIDAIQQKGSAFITDNRIGLDMSNQTNVDNQTKAKGRWETGLGRLQAAAAGEKVNGRQISPGLQAVVAGTLGNQLDTNGIIVRTGSGVMSSADTSLNRKTGSQIQTLNVSTNKGGALNRRELSYDDTTAAGALHEMTHIANGQIYGNPLSLSVPFKAGETDFSGYAEGDERIDAMTSALNDDGEYLSEVKRRESMLQGLTRYEKARGDGKIGSSGALIPNDSLQYAGSAGLGITQTLSAKTFQANQDIDAMKTTEAQPACPHLGKAQKNSDWVKAFAGLNTAIGDATQTDAGTRGDMSSLLEYDSKLTDTYYLMETTGNFDEKNPSHRRLKAMVMDAYVKRMRQQNTQRRA